MPVTKLPADITAADRPFLLARGNADGTVTLYYAGDTIPAMPSRAAAEAAAAAADLKLSQDVAAATADAKLRAVVNMTPAQVRVWVEANVANLAQAKDVLATLAVAVSILARRL